MAHILVSDTLYPYYLYYTFIKTSIPWYVVRPGRLERLTYGFEVRRSIQLSYGRTALKPGVSDGVRTHGHRIHNPALCQLSYTHHIRWHA